MKNKSVIIYAGTNGFPFGLAQMERQKLIARGLQEAGAEVIILCRYGLQDEADHKTEFDSNVYNGIKFVYASGNPYRPGSFIKRNIQKFKGLFHEFKIIRKQKSKSGLTAILVSTLAFYNVLYYKIISLVTGVPLVLDNVEYFSSMNIRKSVLKKLDNYLYDHYSHVLADKVVGISDFLISVVQKRNPLKPVIKIPAIVDFSQFKSDSIAGEDFFLYCGNAGYFQVINFVISSFEKIENRGFALYLVVNGNETDMNTVWNRINVSPRKDLIHIFSRLPVQELIDLYMTSKALLIPLRNTKQDIARFPHKIGEYTAAGKPIVSTNIGEIGKYFTDGATALLADQYSESTFAAKMQSVIDNPVQTRQIGVHGHELGKGNFDFLVLGKKLNHFISHA